MNCTSLAWYEQEYLRYKAHFDALPKALRFLRLFAMKVVSQRYCSLVLRAGVRVHKTHNSALSSS